LAVWKEIKARWEALSKTRKSILAVGTVCLLLSLFFFYHWMTKIEYAPLFTNLQADAAGRIVEELKSLNVSYQLADAGQTIKVPADQVYDLRLNLASKGVISEGGYGFELFDESDIGATDFERNINYQRALQEELRRTICQLDAVKQARVHLVLPEKSAFINNDRKAQASIVLELRPLVKLENEQIKGIAELAAGSVQGLEVQDVKIIDTAGHVLSDSIKNNADSNLELSQLELKKNFENDLEMRVQRLLDSIYGPDKAVVMITANLDFNQKQVERIVYGKTGAIASEQVSQKTSGSSINSLPVGDANRDETLTADGALSGITDMTSTKNYELDKMSEKEVYAPGRVISLSTAVAVNGDLPADAEMRIKDTVSAAIGFNSQRGDTINMLSTEFDQTEMEAMQAELDQVTAAEKKQQNLENYFSWGLKGFGLLIALILGLMLIRALRSLARDNADFLIDQPATVRTLEEQMQKGKKASAPFSEDEEIRNITKDQPDVAAQIINNWLVDDSGSGVSG